MITKMKKVTLLVFHQEYDTFLSQLQNLGVVHIQELESGSTSTEFEQAKGQAERYTQALAQLETLSRPEENAHACKMEFQTAEQVATFIEEQLALQQELARKAENTRKDLDTALPFGQFQKEKLQALAQAGYQMHFYTCTPTKFQQEWADAYYATPVAENDQTIWFVTFSPQQPTIEAEHVELPALSIPELRAQADDISRQQAQVLQQLWAVKEQYTPLLEEARIQAQNAIQLSRVHLNSQDLAGSKLKLVEGWIPEDKEAQVRTMLDASGAYYEIRNAQKGDRVPIQFKNDWYSRMFERLTKMYGFPSYDEWDPTPIVAPFFTLFFAICMGDAGYGLLILLYGLLDMSGKAKNVPILGEMLEGCGSMICALGVATTVIGFFLGTFFGINIVEAGWIPQSTAIGSLLAWLQGTVPGTTYKIQMAAAICIGVFHICLAMVIKAALYTQKEGFKSQISTWGWVLLLVGGVITGVMFLFGALSQNAAVMVLIGIGAVSALAIYFLNNVERLTSKPIAGLLINPLAGLYDTYNMASGLMGDILSYIRLYALCLAGGMLGGAFNMIGDMVRGDEGSMLLLIPAILIYVVGHLFNLLMSAISAFVHPLRLNFVEYFKNAGYEGKGEAYAPFKVKK